MLYWNHGDGPHTCNLLATGTALPSMLRWVPLGPAGVPTTKQNGMFWGWFGDASATNKMWNPRKNHPKMYPQQPKTDKLNKPTTNKTCLLASPSYSRDRLRGAIISTSHLSKSVCNDMKAKGPAFPKVPATVVFPKRVRPTSSIFTSSTWHTSSTSPHPSQHLIFYTMSCTSTSPSSSSSISPLFHHRQHHHLLHHPHHHRHRHRRHHLLHLSQSISIYLTYIIYITYIFPSTSST